MNTLIAAWCTALAFGGSLGLFSRALRNLVADENDITTRGGEE